MQVRVENRNPNLRNVSTQFDPDLEETEVVLTEEKLQQMKEDIASHIICELEINRKTLNMLTNDQELVLNKMGKFMGDFYFSDPSRNQHYAPAIYKQGNDSAEIVKAKQKKKQPKIRSIVRMFNGGGNISLH
jgi:hypothetical protein